MYKDIHNIIDSDYLDIKSWLYADAYLRYPELDIPLFKIPFYYKESGILVPISCLYSQLFYVTAGATSDADVTTAGGDTSLCDILIVQTCGYSAAPPLSDSKGNTSNFVGLTAHEIALGGYSRLWYCKNPIVGTGHTFTAGGGGLRFPTILVLGFSGSHLTNPYEGHENGATASSGTTLATGSITPSENNCLIISGISLFDSTSATQDAGMTDLGGVVAVAGQHVAGVMTYKIQTTATAINPTWSNNIGTTTGWGVGIASFRPATFSFVPKTDAMRCLLVQ